MNRLTRKLVSLICIATVLLAQFAVSLYACPLEVGAPVAQGHAAASADAPSNCHETSAPVLCKKHCENGEQNVNDSLQPLAFVALVPAFVVTLAMDSHALHAADAPARLLQHATSPPLSIRHCCFRI